MKNIKKVLTGVLALSMVSGLAACGSNGTGEDTTTSAATTTTGATVEVNTEGLQEGEQEKIDSAASQLRDFELENKELKWLGNYQLNPDTDGKSKNVALELFEQKYGGTIKDYVYEWADLPNQYSALTLGGEGIDMYPGDDTRNFPSGIISGKFQPVDDYIDINSAIWQNVKDAMEVFQFGGKHFSMVTNVTAEQVCLYNKQTIEENGLEDPWELYEKGEWNWDTFKGMLQDFVDVENGMYGLDGWYIEKSLYTSAGACGVKNVDGHVVSMLNDATLEQAMNFGYELYQNSLIRDLSDVNWEIQPPDMGAGKELFLLWGTWGVQGEPSTWWSAIPEDKLGIVPVPSPAGSDPYGAATIAGYAICKGAENPEAAALYAECCIVANNDPDAQAVGERKLKDDSHWSDELIEHEKVCNDLVRQYPIFDFAQGTSADVASYTTDGGGEVGLRAPFHGVDWATERERIGSAVDKMISEADSQLQAKIAEFSAE